MNTGSDWRMTVDPPIMVYLVESLLDDLCVSLASKPPTTQKTHAFPHSQPKYKELAG